MFVNGTSTTRLMPQTHHTVGSHCDFEDVECAEKTIQVGSNRKFFDSLNKSLRYWQVHDNSLPEIFENDTTSAFATSEPRDPLEHHYEILGSSESIEKCYKDYTFIFSSGIVETLLFDFPWTLPISHKRTGK